MSELTRVDFYILPVSVPDGDERARARYACRLAEKAYKLGNRIHVRAASAAAPTEFDELLWTFRQGSFVPHEIARAGTAPQSPVTIGAAGTVPPDADLLINLADTMPENAEGFRCVAERQTVVGLSLPTLSQPAFVLKPENVFHKVGSAFGMQDIDLPQAPNFSRRFLLRGVQEHAIRAAFNPGVLDFFERHEGMSAEGRGNQLIYYRLGRLPPPAEIRSFIRQGCEVAKLLAGSPAGIAKVVRIQDY